MKNQSILDIEVSRKRLLIRADLNVPINDEKITDDTRIARFCQGMSELLQKGISNQEMEEKKQNGDWKNILRLKLLWELKLPYGIL